MAELKRIGEYLGYPDCCIEAFLKHLDDPSWWESYAKDHWAIGTGYVPCPKCAEKPRKILEGEIQKKRMHHWPWPNLDFEVMERELRLEPLNA